MRVTDKLRQAMIRAYKHVAIRYWTFGPRAILVETTKSCNLKCPGCRRNYEFGSIYHEPGEPHLTVGALWRIIATTNVSYVRWEGDGEPLTNPNFRELMKFCKQMGIRSTMTSNATLLTPKYVQFLEAHGMTRIHVSFDGATKDTYEKVKLGATYEDTIRNCKLIGNSGIQLFMNVVLFSDAVVDELPKYVEQAVEAGATGIHYMKMQQDSLEFGSPPDLSEHKKTIDKFNQLTRDAGLMVVGTCSDTPTFVPCYDPFINPFVLLNNDVYACTYMANLRRKEVYNGEVFNTPYKSYKMGNLEDDWMKNIWFGDDYTELRRALEEDRLPTGSMAEPEALVVIKRRLEKLSHQFAFCGGCLCQWGESGL